ncbi:MAG: zinc ribbon domain-containing protein [Ruminococcus sp.]|nr:zinc ribbon domain-containing protein [Ruminococcus sp.]
MGILDKIGGVSKSVSDATKNASDAGNLKNKILYEQERITEIFTEMGKTFYENPDGDLSPLRDLCEDIDKRKNRIQKMRLELNQMKGYKICPKCGTKLTDKFQFCGKCGTKLPDINDDDFSVSEIS